MIMSNNSPSEQRKSHLVRFIVFICNWRTNVKNFEKNIRHRELKFLIIQNHKDLINKLEQQFNEPSEIIYMGAPAQKLCIKFFLKIPEEFVTSFFEVSLK